MIWREMKNTLSQLTGGLSFRGTFFFNHLADTFGSKNNYHIQDLMLFHGWFSQFFDVRLQCGNHPWCSFSSGHTLDPRQTCRAHHPLGFSKYPHLLCWIAILPPDQQYYLHKYRYQKSSRLHKNNSQIFMCAFNLNLSRTAQIISS